MKPFGSGVFFVGRFLTTYSISLISMELLSSICFFFLFTLRERERERERERRGEEERGRERIPTRLHVVITEPDA